MASLMIPGTVAFSYAGAFGLSVLVWQHLIGLPLHWLVLPLTFIILVPVGSDYNLLLIVRVKEELHARVYRPAARHGDRADRSWCRASSESSGPGSGGLPWCVPARCRCGRRPKVLCHNAQPETEIVLSRFQSLLGFNSQISYRRVLHL